MNRRKKNNTILALLKKWKIKIKWTSKSLAALQWNYSLGFRQSVVSTKEPGEDIGARMFNNRPDSCCRWAAGSLLIAIQV